MGKSGPVSRVNAPSRTADHGAESKSTFILSTKLPRYMMNKDDRSGTGGAQNDISMPVENSRLARIRINTLCIVRQHSLNELECAPHD